MVVLVRVGRAAGRHPAQRRRRADRGAAAGRLPARPPPGDQAVTPTATAAPRTSAGLFVIAMITLSSALAAYEAIDRLHPPARASPTCGPSPPPALVGFVGNEIVARYRIRVGRRIGSAALVADGLHARTDGFTSLAVLLGAGGVALGWRWADPIVGLLITVAILGVLRSAVRQVGARLMDAVDPDLVDQATAAVATRRRHRRRPRPAHPLDRPHPARRSRRHRRPRPDASPRPTTWPTTPRTTCSPTSAASPPRPSTPAPPAPTPASQPLDDLTRLTY